MVKSELQLHERLLVENYLSINYSECICVYVYNKMAPIALKLNGNFYETELVALSGRCAFIPW